MPNQTLTVMPYLLHRAPGEEFFELICQGCGADILVGIYWEQVGFDDELQCFMYEPRFLSVACDMKMEYGCMCSVNSAHMQPEALLKQVQDLWQSDNERRAEKRWER